MEEALNPMTWTAMNRLRHHFTRARNFVHDLLMKLDVDYLLQADKDMDVWKTVFNTRTKLDEINDQLNSIRRMDEGISHYVIAIHEAAVKVDELFVITEQAWLGYPFAEDRRDVLHEYAGQTTLRYLEGLEEFCKVVCEIPLRFNRVPNERYLPSAPVTVGAEEWWSDGEDTPIEDFEFESD